MSTRTHPVTIVIVPESLDGFLSLLQDLWSKAGKVSADIDGFRAFRDYSYLGTAEDELDDLQTMIRLLQAGLIAAQHSDEA